MGSQRVCQRFNEAVWGWEAAGLLPITRRLFAHIALDDTRQLFVGGKEKRLTCRAKELQNVLACCTNILLASCLVIVRNDSVSKHVTP